MDIYGSSSYESSRPRLTLAVQRILFANILLFVAQLLLDIPLGERVARFGHLGVPGGFIVQYLFPFQPTRFFGGFLWQPVTYMFLHGGLSHLFMNMLMLYVFGPSVERALGTRQFYWFYLVCGAGAVLGTLVPWVLFRGYGVSVVGASGAVMAVLVALAVINPDAQIVLLPIPWPVTMRGIALIFLALNLFWAISPGGNTSVATHLGGMALGLVYMTGMPTLRRFRTAHKRKRGGGGEVDPVGKMVDNIFRFEKRRRRH